MKQKAKFSVNDLLPIGITFVVVTIALAYGLDIVADIRDSMGTGSAEQNATINGITALSNLTGKLPTIALVVVAAVIIGVLISYFARQ